MVSQGRRGQWVSRGSADKLLHRGLHALISVKSLLTLTEFYIEFFIQETGKPKWTKPQLPKPPFLGFVFCPAVFLRWGVKHTTRAQVRRPNNDFDKILFTHISVYKSAFNQKVLPSLFCLKKYLCSRCVMVF